MSIITEGFAPGIAPDAGMRTLSPAKRASAALTPWRLAQNGLLGLGVLLVGGLLFWPEMGLAVLWNVLIPVAPALVTIAPGLWRNICPMATASLLPRRLGLSRQRIASQNTVAVLSALGVVALLLIIPLRHLSFNTNGPMTALMLVLAAMAAIAAGSIFDWRSGWCATLCPISGVEKLYGQSPAVTLPNTRCDSCHRCMAPCPDSTRSMSPIITGPHDLQKALGHGLTGGFSGFIWGWYQLPDYQRAIGLDDVLLNYAWPFGCAAATLVVYAAARQLFFKSRVARNRLIRVFAAAAVSTYYWYRIPALVGFGLFPDTGVLYDMTGLLPSWFPFASQAVTTTFFLWFLAIRRPANLSWTDRPAFATTA